MMNVSDIMTRKPVTIGQQQTLHEALQKMAGVGCHHLPVTSTAGHLIGILSEHDCRRALGMPPRSDNYGDYMALAKQTTVSMAMTAAPIIVEPGEPVHEAARLMLSHHIHCLPVMRGETLVGIITTSDLLIAFMNLTRRSTRLMAGE